MLRTFSMQQKLVKQQVDKTIDWTGLPEGILQKIVEYMTLNDQQGMQAK